MQSYGQVLNLSLSHCGISSVDVEDESFNQFRAWISSRLADFWSRQPFSFNTEQGTFTVSSGKITNPEGSPKIQKVLSLLDRSPLEGDSRYNALQINYRIGSEEHPVSQGGNNYENRKFIEVYGAGNGEKVWLKYMSEPPSFDKDPLFIESLDDLSSETKAMLPAYNQSSGDWFNAVRLNDGSYSTHRIDIPEELFHAIAYAVASDYQLHNENLGSNRTFLALAEEVFNSRSVEYEEMNVGQGSRYKAAW